MKESLLSIGEAAKLKNVSIKSLRYYERIGIFTPAYIDPETKYRYYALSQMFDLDVIITCLELGIPLKSLQDYRTKTGSLDLQSLLTKGVGIANQNIERAQQSLLQINSWLKEIEVQDSQRKQVAPFMRQCETWHAFTTPMKPIPFDVRAYLKTMRELYQQIRTYRATPLYFQGFLIDSADKAISTQSDLSNSVKSARASNPNPEANFSCFAYVQFEPYPDSAILEFEQTITIQEATFEGVRIEEKDLSSCVKLAFLYIQQYPGRYILTEVWDEELSQDIYVIELLKQVVEF